VRVAFLAPTCTGDARSPSHCASPPPRWCRPHVVECLLSLHDWQRSVLHAAVPPSARSPCPTTAASAAAESPSNVCTPPAAPLPAADAQAWPAPPQGFSFTPQAVELVGRQGPAGQEASDGLNYLMRSCTHMLKSRMGVPGTPLPPLPRAAAMQPDIALDAVGPILETVLANLTSEYERRLLAKDQEHKAQGDAVRALQRRVDGLQAEAAQLRAAAETAGAEVAAKAAGEAQGEACYPMPGKTGYASLVARRATR